MGLIDLQDDEEDGKRKSIGCLKEVNGNVEATWSTFSAPSIKAHQHKLLAPAQKPTLHKRERMEKVSETF